MNAKKAKALRRQLRAGGIAVSDAKYTVTDASIKAGNPFGMQYILDPACGRKVYKGLKK